MVDANAKSPFVGFVTHETDGQSTAAAEGSIETPPAPGEASEDTSEGDVSAAVDDTDAPDDADDTGAPDDTDDADDADDADAPDDADDADDADDTDAPDDADDADDADEEETPKKKKLTAKQRIAVITKARREAEREGVLLKRENADLNARLDRLEKKLTAPDEDATDEPVSTNIEDGRPKSEDFKYGELDPAYIEALTEFQVKKTLAAERSKDEEKEQAQAAQEAATKVKQDYDEALDRGNKAYDDFEKVVVQAADKGDYPLTEVTTMLVLQSPVGHDVIYAIATDLELAKRIAQMSDLDQAKEFGRIEAQFSSKDATPKKKVTGTTPPPRRRSGGHGAQQVDASTSDFASFEKKAMAEARRNA